MLNNRYASQGGMGGGQIVMGGGMQGMTQQPSLAHAQQLANKNPNPATQVNPQQPMLADESGIQQAAQQAQMKMAEARHPTLRQAVSVLLERYKQASAFATQGSSRVQQRDMGLKSLSGSTSATPAGATMGSATGTTGGSRLTGGGTMSGNSMNNGVKTGEASEDDDYAENSDAMDETEKKDTHGCDTKQGSYGALADLVKRGGYDAVRLCELIGTRAGSAVFGVGAPQRQLTKRAMGPLPPPGPGSNAGNSALPPPGPPPMPGPGQAMPPQGAPPGMPPATPAPPPPPGMMPPPPPPMPGMSQGPGMPPAGQPTPGTTPVDPPPPPPVHRRQNIRASMDRLLNKKNLAPRGEVQAAQSMKDQQMAMGKLAGDLKTGFEKSGGSIGVGGLRKVLSRMKSQQPRQPGTQSALPPGGNTSEAPNTSGPPPGQAATSGPMSTQGISKVAYVGGMVRRGLMGAGMGGMMGMMGGAGAGADPTASGLMGAGMGALSGIGMGGKAPMRKGPPPLPKGPPPVPQRPNLSQHERWVPQQPNLPGKAKLPMSLTDMKTPEEASRAVHQILLQRGYSQQQAEAGARRMMQHMGDGGKFGPRLSLDAGIYAKAARPKPAPTFPGQPKPLSQFEIDPAAQGSTVSYKPMWGNKAARDRYAFVNEFLAKLAGEGITTSATGESTGLKFNHKPDHYMQGQDAWASLSGYFKGNKYVKEQPDPFKGKHRGSEKKAILETLGKGLRLGSGAAGSGILGFLSRAKDVMVGAGSLAASGAKDVGRAGIGLLRSPGAAGKSAVNESLTSGKGMVHPDVLKGIEDAARQSQSDRHLGLGAATLGLGGGYAGASRLASQEKDNPSVPTYLARKLMGMPTLDQALGKQALLAEPVFGAGGAGVGYGLGKLVGGDKGAERGSYIGTGAGLGAAAGLYAPLIAAGLLPNARRGLMKAVSKPFAGMVDAAKNKDILGTLGGAAGSLHHANAAAIKNPALAGIGATGVGAGAILGGMGGNSAYNAGEPMPEHHGLTEKAVDKVKGAFKKKGMDWLTKIAVQAGQQAAQPAPQQTSGVQKAPKAPQQGPQQAQQGPSKPKAPSGPPKAPQGPPAKPQPQQQAPQPAQQAPQPAPKAPKPAPQPQQQAQQPQQGQAQPQQAPAPQPQPQAPPQPQQPNFQQVPQPPNAMGQPQMPQQAVAIPVPVPTRMPTNREMVDYGQPKLQKQLTQAPQGQNAQQQQQVTQQSQPQMPKQTQTAPASPQAQALAQPQKTAAVLLGRLARGLTGQAKQGFDEFLEEGDMLSKMAGVGLDKVTLGKALAHVGTGAGLGGAVGLMRSTPDDRLGGTLRGAGVGGAAGGGVLGLRRLISHLSKARMKAPAAPAPVPDSGGWGNTTGGEWGGGGGDW